jgi:hypothetical protein
LNDVTLQAFLDELGSMEKDAGIAALGRWVAKQPAQFLEAGRRLRHPVKAMKAGWREMTPSAQLQHLKATKAPTEFAAAKKEFLGRRAGKHLTEGTRSKHAPVRLAEELSRRGWTGKGRFSKYVPLASAKGLTVGTTALAAPEMVEALKKRPTPTGEGGVAERGLGEAAGFGAMLAGMGGLGFLPATALYMGAHGLGSKAGRVLDRLRGGADIGTALHAPSPRRAQELLSTIHEKDPEEQRQVLNTLRKHYG